MKKDEFFVLATKYLSGEASGDEMNQMHSLLKMKKYSALFNNIDEKWKRAGTAESSSTYNVDRGKRILFEKIRRYNPSFQWEKEVQQQRAWMVQPMFRRVAASFALVILLVSGGVVLVNVLKQSSGSMTWNEKKTVMGEKSIVTLLDGTTITLNADSKLKYPVRFGEDSREVILEGEAFFEVAPDANKPFVVHTGNISTTDLGTKFDVSAFPNEETIRISLEEGKVNVSTPTVAPQKGDVILSPTQQLIYNKENESSTIEQFDMQKALGWKDNILIFDNEPLSRALKPLERYFGVTFDIADRSLANRKIKANFKNESFWTVVKVLEKATGLSYTTIKERNELKKIVFYEK